MGLLNRGAPNDCFLQKGICSKKQKLPSIFYSLKDDSKYLDDRPFKYDFRRLSNKIPTIF